MEDSATTEGAHICLHLTGEHAVCGCIQPIEVPAFLAFRMLASPCVWVTKPQMWCCFQTGSGYIFGGLLQPVAPHNRGLDCTWFMGWISGCGPEVRSQCCMRSPGTCTASSRRQKTRYPFYAVCIRISYATKSGSRIYDDVVQHV